MEVEKILELIKLRTLAKQKSLSGNVKRIRQIRMEMRKSK